MMDSRVSSIKRSQKEAHLFRIISELIREASIDHEVLRDLTVSRVSLSSDKSSCSVFFFIPEGKATFKEKLERLKLFKPSLRKAVAERIKARYVPQIIFKFDDKIEKQLAIESLLDKVKEEISEE
jgi:ribosome-binding factor A